jgi:sugar fermentation stimulation protein A
MNYPNTVAGTFVSRPNRFIAKVMINGEEETVHVKNTGRCRELLLPGATVILTRSDNPNRKTQYDLIAVYKGDTLINMDSQAPNAAARELLQRLYPLATVRAEQRYGSSRFDFALDLPSGTMFVEVKGVTLERQGHAFFPDAPTQRGAKHLRELIAARQAGNKAAVLFLVQMKGIHALSPNDETDPDFAKALREAHAAGVDILCYDCIITEDSMTADKPVAVLL